MNKVIQFDDKIVSELFSVSISEANIYGWHFFKDKVMGKADDIMKGIVFQLIIDSTNLRKYRTVCEESMALVIASLSPVTMTDRNAIKLVLDRYFFQKMERPKVLLEGLVFCEKQVPKFYQSYKDYLSMVLGNEIDAYHELLAISWLVVLIIGQSYEHNSKLSLSKKYE